MSNPALIALLEELENTALRFKNLQIRMSFLSGNELNALIMEAEEKGYISATLIHHTWDREKHQAEVNYQITAKGREVVANDR